ncbi:MAG TPA: acetylxylan esterase [Bradyrhizobium sp.]
MTLTVDSFGPRGIKTNCGSAPDDLALDAYRALDFLVREPFVDPARVAVLGFAQGGGLVLISVEHGANKHRQTSSTLPLRSIRLAADLEAT